MFAPPGTKKLIYFIDDVNMPSPDKYGTQSASALLRQQIDYGGFYDLNKLTLKTLLNVQYFAAMDPAAGSFRIDSRMQRHFATFATPLPDAEVLSTIYTTILARHLAGGFSDELAALVEPLVGATLSLHQEVSDSFMPNAVKFHYVWSLRELSALTQGICLSRPAVFAKPIDMVWLWAHEAWRVYGDRLSTEADISRFDGQVVRISRNWFHDLLADQPDKPPAAFATFAASSASAADDVRHYAPVRGEGELVALLEASLADYNSSRAKMDLVLFEQAVSHVCRIARIFSIPQGNAMLVGVGGSGKQSLTRLAAHLCGRDVSSLKISQG